MNKIIVDNLILPLLENPALWLVVAVCLGGVIWFVFRYLHKNQLETMRSQLELKNAQLLDYKAKLDGASPSEAASQIRILESQVETLAAAVKRLQPRSLTDDQKRSMIAALIIGKGSRISVAKDAASPDAAKLAPDLIGVFQSAGWDVQCPMVMGLGNPPPTGVSVAFVEGDTPSVPQQAVINALNAANIRFDVRNSRNSPRKELNAYIAEITITTSTL